MKHAFSIAFALLIGFVLAVSTAQATSLDPHGRYRYFQDVSVTGQFPGRIVIGVLYSENSHGQFTPREAVAYDLQVGVSCNPGGDSVFRISGDALSYYSFFDHPLRDGRFSHRFENQYEVPALAAWKGGLSGTVVKKLKRRGRVIRTARIDGTFNVEDWDPYGMAGVQENCTSPASSYSATPCKLWTSRRDPHYDRWKRWKVPVCYVYPWAE